MATQILQQSATGAGKQHPLHLTGAALDFSNAKVKADVLSHKPSRPFRSNFGVTEEPKTGVQLGSFTSPWSLNVIGKPREPWRNHMAPRVKAYIDETEALDAGSCFMAIAETARTRDEREIPEQVLTMIQRLRKFDDEWATLKQGDKDQMQGRSPNWSP